MPIPRNGPTADDEESVLYARVTDSSPGIAGLGMTPVSISVLRGAPMKVGLENSPVNNSFRSPAPVINSLSPRERVRGNWEEVGGYFLRITKLPPHVGEGKR